jgi:hypothetical protein
MNDQDEPPGGKKHETTVYIANLSEDVWPFIRAISSSSDRQAEIEENARLSDRDLFSLSGENHIIFIAPKPVSPELLRYFKEITGVKDIDIIFTKTHSGEICRDILADTKIMDRLVIAANSSRRLSLVSYSTTIQFLELVEALEKRGITVATPESPEEENAWTVNFYGSKSGIRQLAGASSAREPDFVMPEGIICVSVTDAARIAANRYVRTHGVVIKTNKGHSGAGLFIFRPGDLPDEYRACEKAILSHLKTNAYWDAFPIVIEDYIAINSAIGGGFPDVEFKIAKNGHIDFLYYCSLRVTSEGVFKGVEINHDVIPEKQAIQLVDTGFFIAEQYASEGYRGYFDVDYAAGKNGKLYVNESNVRRTGATHVYHVADKLFGHDFMYETYILSNNLYDLPKDAPIDFNLILKNLKPVLFDKKTKEGVVVISESVLAKHQFGYIVFGKNRKRAFEIETRMEELLT